MRECCLYQLQIGLSAILVTLMISCMIIVGKRFV